MSTAIWNASAGTPTATHRIPVDTSGAGTPTMYTVQQVADLETSVGTSVNALGSIAVNTAIDLALGGFVSATIGANLTLSFTNPPAGGTEFTLVLTNGGAFTVTWPGAVTWAGATAPTLTASGVDVLHFASGNGGTNWYGWLERDETAAAALLSATTTVSVSSATAPSSGQVLTATSSTSATWQTPSGGGGGTLTLADVTLSSASQSSTYAGTTSATASNMTDGSATTGTGTDTGANEWISVEWSTSKLIIGVRVGGGVITGFGSTGSYQQIGPTNSVFQYWDGSVWKNWIANQVSTPPTDTGSETTVEYVGMPVVTTKLRLYRVGAPQYLGLTAFVPIELKIV